MNALQLQEGDFLYDLLMTELPPLVSLLITMLLGALALSAYLFIKREDQRIGQPSYKDRIDHLTRQLTESSAAVDDVLLELTTVAAQRQQALQQLEQQLATMETTEKALAGRIRDLHAIPLPVADHFANIVRQGEKRSARRDYILFGLGAFGSYVVSKLLDSIRH